MSIAFHLKPIKYEIGQACWHPRLEWAHHTLTLRDLSQMQFVLHTYSLMILTQKEIWPQRNWTSVTEINWTSVTEINPIILWFAWPVKWSKKICMKATKSWWYLSENWQVFFGCWVTWSVSSWQESHVSFGCRLLFD